jgi:WD40 repeat protein
LTTILHKKMVRAVAFTPDGSLGISACFDGRVRVWDVISGKVYRRAKTRGRTSALALSPNGKEVAAGTTGGDLYLWELATGKKRFRKRTGRGDIYQLAFAPDGLRVATADHDRSVSLWDIQTGKRIRRFAGHGGRVWTVAFSPDGRFIASGAENGVVSLWDPVSGKRVQKFRCPARHVSAVAFSPSGGLLAAACLEDTYTGPGQAEGGPNDAIMLWSVETGQQVAKITTPAPYCVAFAPDGWNFVSGDRQHQIRVWGMSTNGLLYSLGGHTDAVFGLAFTRDGRKLASCGADGRVCVWLLDEEIPF